MTLRTDPQVYKLLEHLHRGGVWGYWWVNPGRTSVWWPVGDPQPLPGGQHNVYFGVHPVTAIPGANAQGESKDASQVRSQLSCIAAISCLFAEFDAKDFDGDKAAALAHVDGLDPSPSVIIDSGGGYHAYWLLKEPYILNTDSKRERARDIQARWVAWVGGDSGAKDLARVLRVPGTTNYKPEYGPDFPVVTVIRADFERLYDLDDLAALLPSETHQTGPTPHADGAAWALAALANETAKLARARDGMRNDTLNRAAYSLGQIIGTGLLERGQVEQALTATALGIGLGTDPGCGPGGIEATIRSGIEAGMGKPRGPKATGKRQEARPAADSSPSEPVYFRPTDGGNALRLVARHGAIVRHCQVWGRWLVWDGRRWATDESGQVIRLAKDTVASMYAEASRTPDDDRRKTIAKHALSSDSAYRLRAMIGLAESESGVAMRPSDFDRDPWLFNVLNGTLDLRSGDLLPHCSVDLVTRLAPTSYDPDACCPIWLAFLDRVMDSNADLIAFLQRAIGYALTGSTREHALFILYGTGANGKSTFLETIRAMCGDYAQQMPATALMLKGAARSESASPDLARLKDIRFVAAIEAEEGQRLAESLVKTLTGGDRVTARFLFGRYFEFDPTHKIFLATNHKPVIRGTDHAIWRRIRLVPFKVTIPEREQDPDMGAKLLTELDGILTWAVRGCQDWQRGGLGTPAEVRQATSDYRDEMDILGAFLEECCIIQDVARVRAGHLYNAYREWCDSNGMRASNSTVFGRRMTERGFDKVKSNHVYYLGIGLLEDERETT